MDDSREWTIVTSKKKKSKKNTIVIKNPKTEECDNDFCQDLPTPLTYKCKKIEFD